MAGLRQKLNGGFSLSGLIKVLGLLVVMSTLFLFGQTMTRSEVDNHDGSILAHPTMVTEAKTEHGRMWDEINESRRLMDSLYIWRRDDLRFQKQVKRKLGIE